MTIELYSVHSYCSSCVHVHMYIAVRMYYTYLIDSMEHVCRVYTHTHTCTACMRSNSSSLIIV